MLWCFDLISALGQFGAWLGKTDWNKLIVRMGVGVVSLSVNVMEL